MNRGIIILWLWPSTYPGADRIAFGVSVRAILLLVATWLLLLLLVVLALVSDFPAVPGAVLGALSPLAALLLLQRPTSSYRYYEVDARLQVVRVLGPQRPAELGESRARWVGRRGLIQPFRKGPS
ncbi:MAG: hypothetical protein ACRC0L_02280 [Angustibacter sp.]